MAQLGNFANTAGDSVFDALNPKNRRRSTVRVVSLEDSLHTDRRRVALAANNHDVFRNMSVLAWAIRRTIDYCCLWDFQPQTTDRGLNQALRELMARDNEPERCDFYGRMSWDDHRRTAQIGQLLNGDTFFARLRNRTIQQIEGPYVRDPVKKKNGARWVNGAKLDAFNRVQAWNVRTINWDSSETDREIAAGNIWQHMQFDHRPNVYRPVSPLTSAINSFRDVDETFDHMRAKVKLDQLFGLAFSRKEDAEALTDDDDDDEGGEESSGTERTINLGNGPASFDLDTGESVEVIQSSNPSQNSQEFLKLCLQVALKCLDLPFNFFDEAYTNFFGSRAAWNLFERSSTTRRESQKRLHYRYTPWRTWQWILPVDFGGTGELVLPASMSVENLKWKWVCRGVPFWKPQEELDSQLRMVAAGLKSMQDVCDDYGFGDYLENIREIMDERAEIERLGFVQRWNPNNLAVFLMDQKQAAAMGAK